MSTVIQEPRIEDLFSRAELASEQLQLHLINLKEKCAVASAKLSAASINSHPLASSVHSQSSGSRARQDPSNAMALALHVYNCTLEEYQEVSTALSTAVETVIGREKDRHRAKSAGASKAGNTESIKAVGTGNSAVSGIKGESMRQAAKSQQETEWGRIIGLGLDEQSRVYGHPCASVTALPINPFSTPPRSSPQASYRDSQPSRASSGHRQHYQSHGRQSCNLQNLNRSDMVLGALRQREQTPNVLDYLAHQARMPQNWRFSPIPILPEDYVRESNERTAGQLASFDGWERDRALLKVEHDHAALEAVRKHVGPKTERREGASDRDNNSPAKNFLLDIRAALERRKEEKRGRRREK